MYSTWWFQRTSRSLTSFGLVAYLFLFAVENTLEDLPTQVRSQSQHVAVGPVERTMSPSLSRLGGKYFFRSSLTRCSARRTSCPRRDGGHDGGPNVEPLFELRIRTPLGRDQADVRNRDAHPERVVGVPQRR